MGTLYGERMELALSIIENHMNARNLPETDVRGVAVERFAVSESDASMFRLRAAVNGRRTRMTTGTYTKLLRHGGLWMSDTPDEQNDHRDVIIEAVLRDAESAVINGLGLGMVVNALLHVPSIRTIDVVEIDPDVIAAVGPYYRELANWIGKSLMIHDGDAYTFDWPRGERWNIAWHDVWESITADNWEEMKRLHRKYARRTDWQESWKRSDVRYLATGRS